MICEHAHPCPPVPSLDADGVWRIAWLTDGVISQQRIVTASVEATKGREMTCARLEKAQSGVGGWRCRRSETGSSSEVKRSG
jgi:hypothetical protein